jgi:HAD superfamily hydrolase (TIGR01457 family)
MALVDRYDAYLFDLDGVLYRADSPVEHAAEAVGRLRELGWPVAFMTNNSARTPSQVAEKLLSVGIRVSADEVVSSAVVTAEMLRERGIEDAFVIGEDGVLEALGRARIRVLGPDAVEAEAVVVGWDRGITYDKLRTAALLVERGAALVATNADPSYPAPDGLWPGAGALLAAVVATTGAEPLVVGKPQAPLFEAACRRAGGKVPLVIGDRLDTDIAGAVALGLDSMLVFTGVSTPEDLARGDVRPTYVGADLRALFVVPEPTNGSFDERPGPRPARPPSDGGSIAPGGPARPP